MTTRHKTIGEMLRERREQLDHGLAEAARQLKVSRQIYPTWESGHALPKEIYLADIAGYLGVEERWLVMQRYSEKIDRAKGAYDVLGVLTNPPVLAAA